MGGWGLARKRGVDRANEGVVMVVVFLQHDEGSFCVMISSVEYLKRNTLWHLFMDGVQLPQGYSHFEEAVYFLPFSSQKFLVLILSTSEG